jgi:DNA-binding beta-propeller fold protein YncE
VAYNKTSNKIYVASATNHVIREIAENEDGSFSVSTIAGIPEKKGYKDGAIDSALFNSPHGVLVREDGALIIIDIGNAKLRLIKDGFVSTLAGKSDEDPLTIDFYYPIDLAFDGNDIIIADAGNHKIFRIKPGISVEEIVLKDTLNTPHGITADEMGNIYIADMGTNRILKINKDGSFSTLIDKTDDTTKVSNLKKPAAVLYDNGFVWIADLDNHQIKRIAVK